MGGGETTVKEPQKEKHKPLPLSDSFDHRIARTVEKKLGNGSSELSSNTLLIVPVTHSFIFLRSSMSSKPTMMLVLLLLAFLVIANEKAGCR